MQARTRVTVVILFLAHLVLFTGSAHATEAFFQEGDYGQAPAGFQAGGKK